MMDYFISLTFKNDGTPIEVNWMNIMRYYQDDDHTVIIMSNNAWFEVKESSAEVTRKIKDASRYKLINGCA